ncbi:MAG: hypothetical protein HC890_11145 [Chloroflexaceae bacterium]|nr:hypothetical protein [Chloroflexaceae bacterium]
MGDDVPDLMDGVLAGALIVCSKGDRFPWCGDHALLTGDRFSWCHGEISRWAIMVCSKGDRSCNRNYEVLVFGNPGNQFCPYHHTDNWKPILDDPQSL